MTTLQDQVLDGVADERLRERDRAAARLVFEQLLPELEQAAASGGRTLEEEVRSRLTQPTVAAEQVPPELIVVGNVRIDTRERTCHRGDRALTLEPKAFDLLVLLATNAGRVLKFSEIMDELWPDYAPNSAYHSMVTTVCRLRRVFGRQKPIETVRGSGYRFKAA